MKKDDLKTKTAAELQNLLQAEQARMAQLRFDLADKKLKRTSDLRQARRTIARLNTALHAAR